jgi:hypothetical protein
VIKGWAGRGGWVRHLERLGAVARHAFEIGAVQRQRFADWLLPHSCLP